MMAQDDIQAMNAAGWSITDYFSTEQGQTRQKCNKDLQDGCRLYTIKAVEQGILAAGAACFALVFPVTVLVAGFFGWCAVGNICKRHYVLKCADRISKCSQAHFYLESIKNEVGKEFGKIQEFDDATSEDEKKQLVEKVQKEFKALKPFIRSLETTCTPFSVQQEIQELRQVRKQIVALKGDALDEKVDQIGKILHDALQNMRPFAVYLQASEVIEKQHLLKALQK